MSGEDVIGGVLGAMRIRGALNAMQMHSIRVRVLKNGEMYEDTGVIKYKKWAVFHTIQRAYLYKKTVRGKAGSILVIDETDLKYDPWEMYKIIQMEVKANPEFKPKTMIIQFVLGAFIGLFCGAVTGLIGVANFVVLVIVVLVYRIIMRGIGYAKA